jgi:hypothetical protein
MSNLVVMFWMIGDGDVVNKWVVFGEMAVIQC